MTRDGVHRIGSQVERVLAGLGLLETFNGWKVCQLWPEFVGEPIASHATATRYEQHTLYVRVTDSVWRHNLSLERENILRKIHSLPYGASVRTIEFVSR